MSGIPNKATYLVKKFISTTAMENCILHFQGQLNKDYRIQQLLLLEIQSFKAVFNQLSIFVCNVFL